MNDHPQYTIPEVLLSGLFISGAVVSLLWAGHLYSDGYLYDAMEYMGLALLLFAGCADPVKYVSDCITFPFKVAKPMGRDTMIVVAGSLLGLGLCTGGWLLNRYA
jgi:hypothetical protein